MSYRGDSCVLCGETIDHDEPFLLCASCAFELIESLLTDALDPSEA